MKTMEHILTIGLCFDVLGNEPEYFLMSNADMIVRVRTYRRPECSHNNVTKEKATSHVSGSGQRGNDLHTSMGGQ